MYRPLGSDVTTFLLHPPLLVAPLPEGAELKRTCPLLQTEHAQSVKLLCGSDRLMHLLLS